MSSTLDALSTHPMFAGLSKKDKQLIASVTTRSQVAKGKTFITEDTTANQAFIVIEGRATVRRKNRIVAGVGPGDVLGEMAIIANMKRTASVTADTDMTVDVLTRGEFQLLLDRVPDIARKIMVSALKRVHELEPSIG